MTEKHEVKMQLSVHKCSEHKHGEFLHSNLNFCHFKKNKNRYVST